MQPRCFGTSHKGKSFVSHQYGRPRARKHLREQGFCHWEIRVSLGDRLTQTTELYNSNPQSKFTQAKKRAGWIGVDTLMA